MKKLLIVGAGGFGRELHAWAGQHPACGREWELGGFLDDDADALAKFGRFAPVRPLAGHRPAADEIYLCGVGMPALKERLVAPLLAAGADFLTFVHPQALVGARVRLGKGVILCPGAVVSVDIELGDFVTVNLNCTIGHDASLGAWATLSAQCDVTGHVRIGDRVFMGSRATVIPGKSVGSRTVVGAGSVVVTDVPACVTVVGIPARVL
jgi:sugar O-acyltransferase (sialic acid O-acetyltransferase NeuD family)